MCRCGDANRAGQHGIQASALSKNDLLKLQCEKDSLLFPVSVFRLHHLESKVIVDVGKTPDIICELKSQVESFKRKLEVRHSNPTKTQQFWIKPALAAVEVHE